MKRACPRTGRICEAACQACKPQGAYGTRNPNRDLVAHNRWARRLKRQYPYCQRCGARGVPLQAHHTYGIHDDRGLVLCGPCHWTVDPYVTN